MEERDIVITEFSYTDTYGQETKVKRTCPIGEAFKEESEIEFLTEEFKMFLLASGFLLKHVDRVTYIEEEEK